MRLVRLLLISLILIIPLGQFGRIPIGGENVNLYMNEVLISSIILLYLVYSLAIRKSFKFPPLSGLIFLFFAVAFISLLNGMRFITLKQWLVSSLYLVRFVIYTGLYFIAYDLVSTCDAEHKEKTAGTLIKSLIISGFLLAVFGFIQLKIFPDFSKLDPELGWDPHQNRLLSTFFDPNFLAAYFVLCLSLVSSLLLFRVKLFSRPWLILGLFVVFIALLVTFSRSGYLMFGISAAVIGILKSRKLLILSLVAFFIAAFFIPRVQTRIAGGVDPDDSAKFRFISWRNTYELIQENPVMGVGFNAYRYAQERYGFFEFDRPEGGRSGAGSDSSLLFVWATTGIFGLLTFICVVIRIGFIALSAFLNGSLSPSARAVSLAVLAGGVGLLAESNFINSLFYPWIMEWVWVMVGVMYALRDQYVQKN